MSSCIQVHFWGQLILYNEYYKAKETGKCGVEIAILK